MDLIDELKLAADIAEAEGGPTEGVLYIRAVGEIRRMQGQCDAWFALMMEIGRRVGCLASSFPDGNNHILSRLPAVESRAAALGRIADSLCEYNESDAKDAARYRWLRKYNVDSFMACGSLDQLDAVIDAQMTVRFANVSCSQCGQDFGPGDHGFSHCENHRGLTPNVM